MATFTKKKVLYRATTAQDHNIKTDADVLGVVAADTTGWDITNLGSQAINIWAGAADYVAANTAVKADPGEIVKVVIEAADVVINIFTDEGQSKLELKPTS